jgi:hypothetical protein
MAISYHQFARIGQNMGTASSSGRTLRNIGRVLLLIGTGIILVNFWSFGPLGRGEVKVVLSVLGPVLFVAGGFMFYRGRQYAAAQVPTEAIVSDAKPDVLYLRSFKLDPSAFWEAFSVAKDSAIGALTEEEDLTEVLKPFGDLVAIGRPGESLPTPGAAKLYVSHEDWQPTVIGKMKTAKLVVIWVGNTPGVLWEMRKAREILRPCQLLLLIMMSSKVYDAFLNEAGQALGVSLPKRESLKKRGSIRGFFRFSADWTPDFLPLKAPRLRHDGHFRTLFKYALKPVFEDYGVKWVEPPIRKMTVFLYIYKIVIDSLLGLFGLLILALLVVWLCSLLWPRPL